MIEVAKNATASGKVQNGPIPGYPDLGKACPRRDQPIERPLPFGARAMLSAAMLSAATNPPLARRWSPALTAPACRLCGARLHRTLIDLGYVPLANRTIAADAPDDEPRRLHARICDNCMLVQLADGVTPIAAPRLHSRACSAVGLAREKHFAESMRKRLRLGDESLVIEVGFAGGSLLQQFRAGGIPVLGIEPGVDAAMTERGIRMDTDLFNTETAMQIAVRHGRADLVVANNVLAQAPDLFDFAAGLACILRPNGVLTVQVPHLLALVRHLQFDAFRHDFYTYLSLKVLEHVLRSVGLRVFDAERLPDHGGSLRIYACHAIGPHAARPGLKSVRLAETAAEVEQFDFYTGFSGRVGVARDEIRNFLRIRRTAGRSVAAYGAATRGSMLLNVCGITTAEIAYVVDPDPGMQGRLLPGSRIPIVPPEALLTDPPHDIVILPWTNAAEIAAGLLRQRQEGTQLWTLLPRISRVPG